MDACNARLWHLFLLRWIMAQYDGSIRILTKISTDMAEKSLGTLSQTIKGTAKEISSLRSKMDALKNESIPSGDYKTLQAELEKAKKKLSELVAKQNEWEKLGVTSGGAWDTLNEEIAKTSDTIDAIKEKMYQLEEAGEAFTMGEETPEYANLERQLQYEEEALRKAQQLQAAAQKTGDPYKRLSDSIAELAQRLNAVRHPIESMKNAFSSAAETMKAKLAGMAATIINGINHPFQAMKKIVSGAISGTSKLLSGIASAAKKVGGTISKAASSMSLFGKSTKNTNGMLQSGFKNILKYGLGIRSFYALVNKFRNAVKEGFSNLAQYSDPVNKSLSSLKSALTQLKNSLATAFAPILTAIAPALTTLINMVSKAATAVGMLIAALTGQKTFVKATAVQEDYAASLGSTAKAAKDANKQLSGLDKLNNLTSNDGGNGGGGGGGILPGDMFETVEIPSAISDLADKMKEVWSGIWDVFKQAWDNKGKVVMEAAKAALSSLKEAALSVGSTFYEVFTNGTGLTWVESGLELLRSMLGVIHSIASAFTEAWNGGAGFENVTALFNMFTKIHGLLTSIGDSFSRVFSNGTGVAIWTNILGIITGVYNIIGNLAESINEAWNTAGLGDSIWQGVLNIINTILGTIHNIIDSTAEWAAQLDFTPLLTSIDTLLKAIEPLTENIGEGLEWFWNNVLLPIGSWAIQEAVPVFLDMISAALEALNTILTAFQPLGMWLWENFLQPLGEWAGDTVITAIETIASLLVWFVDTILPGLQSSWQELSDALSPLGEFLKNTFISIWEDMLNPILSYLSETVIPMLVTAFENLWNNVLVPLGEFIGSVLGPIFEFLAGVLSSLWQNVVVPLAGFIGGVFSKAFEGISEILNKTVVPIIKKVIEVFQFLWNKVLSPVVSFLTSTFKPIFDSVFKAIGSIIDGLKKTFGGLIDFITGVFTGNWEKAWNGVTSIFEGILDVIKGVINGILGVIEGLANGVINGINFVIGALNKLHIDIPAPIAKLTGFESFGFDIPELKNVSIPRLATGAVIPANKEFLAVLGDQKHGTNIEAPLDTIKQASKEAVLDVLSELGVSAGNNKNSGNETFVFQVDGKTFFEIMRKEAQQHFNRTGRPAFPI